MRKNKLFALIISGLMAFSAMPVISVSAEEYELGDIDMDGIITEHDAVVLYRILDEETGVITPGPKYLLDTEPDKAIPLSEEQKALADMNGDGVVDYTDADIILENSEYHLGDVNMDGIVNVDDAIIALQEYANYAVGIRSTDNKITKVQESLANVWADNAEWCPTMGDASGILHLYAWNAAGLTKDDLKDKEDYYAPHNYFYAD